MGASWQRRCVERELHRAATERERPIQRGGAGETPCALRSPTWDRGVFAPFEFVRSLFVIVCAPMHAAGSAAGCSASSNDDRRVTGQTNCCSGSFVQSRRTINQPACRRRGFPFRMPPAPIWLGLFCLRLTPSSRVWLLTIIDANKQHRVPAISIVKRFPAASIQQRLSRAPQWVRCFNPPLTCQPNMPCISMSIIIVVNQRGWHRARGQALPPRGQAPRARGQAL